MGNDRIIGARTDQTIHVKLPRDDYERLRYYLMKKGFLRGGVTHFVQRAVKKELDAVEQEPQTFEQAFMAQWNKPPRALHKWQCYGAVIDSQFQGPIARQVGRFTIPELQRHHDTSRWDERTYVLVEEQIKHHRASGIAWNEERPLIPPIPTAVIDEPAQTQAIVEAVEQAKDWAFDPRTQCFIEQCPQLETCAEAKGCCASPEEEAS